jgi:hypothetical protein
MNKKTIRISKETAEKNGYYLFGGKGDVWSDTAHLSHGGMATTLCGRPMLSTNWVRINEVKEVGCDVCSRLFDLAISL